MDIGELLAREQIRDVLFRYCRGVDRGDRDLIASIYHPDAVDEHGTFEGSGLTFADFIVEAMDGVEAVGQHHLTNILIEVQGEQAIAESFSSPFTLTIPRVRWNLGWRRSGGGIWIASIAAREPGRSPTAVS